MLLLRTSTSGPRCRSHYRNARNGVARGSRGAAPAGRPWRRNAPSDLRSRRAERLDSAADQRRSDRRWPPLPACRVVVAAEVDTDRLGTFTGEVERPGPPRETALMKARLGQRATGLPRALASEGVFGPTRTRS